MKTKKKVATLSSTEKDLLDAFQRILDGSPRNAALQRKAKLGTLRVSIASVALEAEHSRTLIGHDGCRYPTVRAAVLDAMDPVAEPRSSAEVISRLRQENAELRLKIKERDSVMAAVLRSHREEIRKLRSAIRAEKRQDGSPPLEQQEQNIKPLRPNSRLNQ